MKRMVREQSVGAGIGLIMWSMVGLVSASSMGCGDNVSDRSLRIVTYTDVADLLDREHELIVLDTRDREQFEAGHIPGAIHMPLSALDEDDAKERFKPYDRVVVYGENPGSALAKALAKRLMRLGVDDVVFYEQGWSEYSRRSPGQ